MQLSNLFDLNSINIDPRILTSLNHCVEAVMNGANLCLTAIGRKLGETISTEKHEIKRVDRLLGNNKLTLKNKDFYQLLAQKFSYQEYVTLMVDWTSVYDLSHVLLRASCSFNGRAFTVYEEVHPEGSMNSHDAHVHFLNNLKAIFPDNQKIILCADAGFKIPWFKEIERLGLNWVARTRGTVKCKVNDEYQWHYVSKQHEGIDSKPKELSKLQLSKQHKFECRGILVKETRAFPINKYKRTSPNDSNYKQHSKSHREPWFLVSNLPKDKFKKEKVIEIYRFRMAIEEAFRDTKNEYYGLGLKRSRSRSVARLQNLLLIGLIAQWCLYVIGSAAEKMDMHHGYQSNTEKKRRVLSYCFLARRILKTRAEFIDSVQFQQYMTELIIETERVICGDS